MLAKNNAPEANCAKLTKTTDKRYMTKVFKIEKEAKSANSLLGSRQWTSSARTAMIHILQLCKSVDTRGILLPSYIGLSQIEGSGVFDPIRTSGIAYEFYDLDRALKPNLASLTEQLKSGKFQLVFLIHYFGCPQVDVEAFCSLCSEYGVEVIEDCAHTITGGTDDRPLGTFGNYAIFSIHKSTTSDAGGFFYDHNNLLGGAKVSQNIQIDLNSLGILANTDLYGIALSRRRNYEKVASWVSSVSGVKLFFDDIGHGDVPLNCPIIVERGLREALYFNLIQKGIKPTALYNTLIPEIDPKKFPDAYFVAENILNLPTHQCIQLSDMETYEEIFKEAIYEVCGHE